MNECTDVILLRVWRCKWFRHRSPSHFWEPLRR